MPQPADVERCRPPARRQRQPSHARGETIARQDVTRILKHIGILPNTETESPSVRLMRVEGVDVSPTPLFPAIFELAVEIGYTVSAGQIADALHRIEGPSITNRDSLACSGLIACRCAPAARHPSTSHAVQRVLQLVCWLQKLILKSALMP